MKKNTLYFILIKAGPDETEILPDNIWPPLILFLVGGVLVVVGLYLNSIRENIISTDTE